MARDSGFSEVKPKKMKSVISLALEEYLDGSDATVKLTKDVLDKQFIKLATSQIQDFPTLTQIRHLPC
jgi:hypothetical protein